MEAFQAWVRENKGLCIGCCIGAAIAILFLAIGFWATLLVAACAGAGAFLGTHPQILEILADWLTSLFNKE